MTVMIQWYRRDEPVDLILPGAMMLWAMATTFWRK